MNIGKTTTMRNLHCMTMNRRCMSPHRCDVNSQLSGSKINETMATP